MKDKKPAVKGRHTLYSDELADLICEQIATTEKGLHAICKSDEAFPSVRTVLNWLADENKKDFLHKYMRAREAQADVMAEKILDLADISRMGKKTRETKDGLFEETGDMVDRSRLQVEARKWLASKLAPKKYGDKLDVTSDGKSLSFNVLTVDEETKQQINKLK